MQTKKAKYHLKRIETILNLREDSLPRLDRDILLDDIRQLYDLVLNAEEENLVKKPLVARDHTFVAQPPLPVQQVQEQVEKDSRENPNPKSPLPMEENKIKPQEEIKTEPQQETYERIGDSPQTPPSPASDREHTPATVTYEHSGTFQEDLQESNEPQKLSNLPTNGKSSDLTDQTFSRKEDDEVLIEEKVSQEYPELFDFRSTSDLSDRLANTKIEHLNKILTINDKILFINHLFNGEAIPFQESLKKFEGFYTYAEAKKYASEELVQTYNWTKQDRYETVRQFMRQVKRLY
jgi:hypothetical protein